MDQYQLAAIKNLAWRQGRLKFLLKPAQKRIYEDIKNSTELIYVVNCSRRLGKTFTMAVIAIEAALQNINFQIHFGAPYQNALRDFLLPIFRQILEDCPEDLRPTWKQLESKWVFKNGSYIKLCGANNGQFDNLRGNKSDLFILDEAAQIDQVENVVNSVALPQLLSSKNPNKKIILPSTPPTTPDHPFKKYAETAKALGAYSHFTIYDAGYPEAEIESMAKQVGGKDSTTFRREFMAEFVVDAALHIVPEWDAKYVQEVKKDDYFQFWTVVEGLDIGYRDFTAWIIGYYDFNSGRLIIEHEYAIKENDFTTETLAKNIKLIEATYQESNKNRVRRISDNNNLNLIADLSKLHKLPFAPVSKNTGSGTDRKGKEWMVSQTRKWINDGNLIIHPRCKMLIASLEFGIWKEGHAEFARSEKLGHYDFIDALIYLVAGLMPSIRNINPVPPLYKINVANTMFPNNQVPPNTVASQSEAIRKMFNSGFKG